MSDERMRARARADERERWINVTWNARENNV